MIKKLIIILFIALWSSFQAFAQPPNVLIIQSYHTSLAWTQNCEKGIHSVLDSYAELKSVYMDTKRIPEADFFKQADRAWASYLKEKPALVMIGDDNALRLLGPRFGKTTTPVVFFGINNNPRNYFDRMPDNITGIMEIMPVIPLLRYLKHILPETLTALVLLDSSLTSEAVAQRVFQDKESLNIQGIHVVYRIANNWEAWKSIVSSMGSSYDILITPTFHAVKRENDSHVSIQEVITWTSAHSPTPLFTNQSYSISDDGAAGAYVTVGETHGKQAAEIAVRILTQEKKPSQISPLTDRKGTFYFNVKQLDRFKITLPKDISQIAHFL